MSDERDLLRRLVEIDVFRVGEFRLKSGVLSPIYIDLRGMIAYPDLIRRTAEAVHSRYSALEAEVVCGVPYTALPIATLYSVLYDLPMVLKRKEAKEHGTRRMVEGVTGRMRGQRCLVMEDIVSSGTSVIETAEVLRREGLVVEDCVVLLNREQGGRENLEEAGIRLHALFTLEDIFGEYCSLNRVEDGLVKSVREYIEQNKFIPVKKSAAERKRLGFEERAKRCSQPVARRLLEIAARKKSNLCVAVDCVASSDLLRLAKQLGPYICMLKTHVDILTDFDRRVTEELSALAKEHDFLLFEDRKFADIGNTVKNQYEQGMYKIREWADVVTVHALPGGGILDALESSSGRERACVLVAEMSSEGALADASYGKKVREMARGHSDFVIGFVCQEGLSEESGLLHLCPGVHVGCAGDSLGQQYRSPEEAVHGGADIVIVGRGICGAEDVVRAAEEYRRRAYEAYMSSVSD